MQIRKLFQISGVAYIGAILIAYYAIGAINFPDYLNYLSIAENNGWVLSENEYLFEWVSRGLLTLGPVVGITPATAVDLLAVINQTLCCMFFLYLLQSEDSNKNYGATLLLAWVGFLLFTTTLRATPAYLALSVFVLRGNKCDWWGVVLLIFGLAWHDSFVLPAALAIFSSITTSARKLHAASEKIHLNRLIVYAAALLLLLAEPLRDQTLALLSVDIGFKEAYLDSDGAQGAVKFTYCSLAILISYQLTGKHSNLAPQTQRFAALMAFAVAAAYMINGVAAVRISMFSYCAFIPLRGIFAFEFEKHRHVRVLQLAGAPILLILNMYDTLQRTI